MRTTRATNTALIAVAAMSLGCVATGQMDTGEPPQLDSGDDDPTSATGGRPQSATTRTFPDTEDPALDSSSSAAPDSSDPTGPGEPTGGTTDGTPTDSCPSVRIDVGVGSSLNLRPSPSTEQAPIIGLPHDLVVERIADVAGESIEGNELWYEVDTPIASGFISSVFATCTTDQAPQLDPLAGFWLPIECGNTVTISQGNFGNFSHQGRTAYAFDFSIGVGTPLVAMADGIVWSVFDETGPGDPCYNGGGSSCFPYANLVLLMHQDGTTSIYKHLSEVHVSVGEFIPRGTTVGLSGSSGYSTGPHAHIMRQEECGEDNCQSLPLAFEDVTGTGVPTTGQTVTSDNCQ